MNPSDRRYLVNIALSILMAAILLRTAHLPVSRLLVAAFVCIHVGEGAGYFYYKKNSYLNAYWFRRGVIGAKILFVLGYGIGRLYF